MTSLWLDRPREPFHDILPADGRFDDLVVGAGITGLTTALLLARAGRRVGVLEARHVGAVATGNTTAKVSLLQGTTLSTSVLRQARDVGEDYVAANREGMEWLLRFCDDHAVPYQRQDAITYAASAEHRAQVEAEHEAARMLGLPTRLVERLDVPFPCYGATVLADQAQVDPWEVLVAMVTQLRAHGGTVHEGLRVRRVSKVGQPRVILDDDTELAADHLVLATGTPILDRGFHFAQLEAQRSYALAFRGATPPAGMFLSAGGSTRSVRSAPGPDSDLLLVGGSGHPVGRTTSPAAHLDELRAWAAEHFPDAVETHAWSAQDYASATGVPIIGRLPLTSGRIFVATGYAKWGMTNGVAAAHVITSDILGSRATVAHGSAMRLRPVVELARINAGVGLEMPTGHLRTAFGMRQPTADDLPDESRPVPVCTHLGGPLAWNDAEGSWDCSLHGSRFDADGSVLEGPATRRLLCRGRK